MNNNNDTNSEWIKLAKLWYDEIILVLIFYCFINAQYIFKEIMKNNNE